MIYSTSNPCVTLGIRKTIPETYYKFLLAKYPELNRPEYMALAMYEMFSSKVDDYDGMPGKFFDKTTLLKITNSRYYAGVDLVMNFDHDVETIKLTPYKFGGIENRARLVKVFWPPDVLEETKKVRCGVYKNDRRIIWEDGSVWSITKAKQFRELENTLASQSITSDTRPVTVKLMKFMNELPVKGFTQLVERNIDKAEVKIAELPEEKQEREQNILATINESSKPFYKATPKSARIYPASENLPLLNKTIRKALMAGFIDADLKSAQLAISAASWPCPKILKFLQQSGNIWEYLANLCGVQLTPETKKAIKNATYAICYGGGEKAINKELNPIGIKANKFLANELMAELWTQRKIQFRVITKNKGARDCFGVWLPLKYEKRDGKIMPNAPSILAQLNQSMELKLMEPVIQLAIANRENKHGFMFLLWQHDGFSWKPIRDSEMAVWANKLIEAVAKQAQILGVCTKLEME